MTWENLTADAEALRRHLGFDRWAVLGHSFGGQVALEYALRYPGSLSHLVLLDTGGDGLVGSRRTRPIILARRGYARVRSTLVRRFFNGQIAPNEMLPAMMRFGGAYYHSRAVTHVARALLRGEWRAKVRPEALIYAGRELLNGWTAMDRLGEITVPTLVMAGRDDFLFPPEHQVELATGGGRSPAHRRTGWPQPARGADRRGDGGRPGLHRPLKVRHMSGRGQRRDRQPRRMRAPPAPAR